MTSESSSSASRDSSSEGSAMDLEQAPRISMVEEGQEEQLRNEEREMIQSSGSEFRQFAFELVEAKWFGIAILVVIFINTAFIGIQTSEYVVAKAEWYMALVDQLFLAVYIMELGLKLYVWRLRFFKQLWNIFDFVIVLASLLDFLIPLIVQNIGVFDARVFRVLRVFRAIRALRALRVLRTIRFLKNLQIIVSTVLQSIPALGSIVILISLVLYIFAIIGRGLYGHVDPERFGNLARASFTLFQLMTLDDWFFMYSDVRDRYPDGKWDKIGDWSLRMSGWVGYQHILLYLLLFIILETFIFINLFVAVIVDNLARTQAAANMAKPKRIPGLHKHKHHEHESEMDVGHVQRQRRMTIADAHVQQIFTADDYYSTEKHSEKERELMGHYLMLLASLEHHCHTARNHQHTLDELIDLVDFTKT